MRKIADLLRWLGVGVLGGVLCVPPAVGAQTAAALTSAPKSGPEGLLSNFSFATERGPITIQAEQMEFDYRALLLTYRGAVIVTQNDVTLTSNTLTVKLAPEGADRLQEIVAEGEVKIDQGERRATGGRAVFDQVARTVTLSNNAILREGANEITGSKVIVFLDEQRSVVEGGGSRVRAVLHPPDEKGAGGSYGR